MPIQAERYTTALLGHTELTTTQIYTQVSIEKLKIKPTANGDEVLALLFMLVQ